MSSNFILEKILVFKKAKKIYNMNLFTFIA